MTALCLSSIFLTKQHYLLDLPITVSIMLCCYVISTKFINCNKFLNDFFIKLVNCFWPFSSNN
jgi:hypothetical protein